MIITSPQAERYIALFERLTAGSGAGDPRWLLAIRQAGMDRFADVGFPTTADEEFKYTSVAPISDAVFRSGNYDPTGLSEESLAEMTYDDSGGARLAFLNGHYSRELSRVDGLPAGVIVESLAAALELHPALIEPHLAHHARIETNPF